MAFERISDRTTIASNLNSYIATSLSLISQYRQRRNLDDESRFSRAVLEDNLTLEQQLEYRQQQLKRVPRGDVVERRRVRDEVASLKNQIEQQKFSDAYLEKLTTLNAGMASVEKTIGWLKARLKNTTDLKIKTDINGYIKDLEDRRTQERRNVIESQTNYALNDKTDVVIDRQITRINSARKDALLAGNDDYVALLDLQLQSLNKTKTESAIARSITNMSVATMTGQSSLALLNALNSEIEKADAGSSITIGGVSYDSARAFWEGKRGEYLNDRSENGFFGRYKSELSEKVEYRSSKGVLNNDSLADAKEWYNYVKDRPELADYTDRITTEEQKSLVDTAKLRAASIINEFTNKLDARKAVNDLAYIQDTYGVDMTPYYQKVINDAAAEKTDQVRQILSTMSDIMTANPGLSRNDALKQAVASGAGASYSPQDLANKTATEVVTDMGGKAEEQQFEEKDTLTVDKTKEGGTYTPPEPFKEGEYYQQAGSKAIMKYEGGKLRTMIGNWDEDTFKRVTGKGFDGVNQVKNISGQPTGEVINATDYQTAAQLGEKVFSPELLKYYQPEQIITRGTEKYLKAGTKPVWGKKVSPTEFQSMQSQYDSETLEKKKIIRVGSDIYYRQQ